MKLANSTSICDQHKVTFASTIVTGSAVIWSYTTAMAQDVPMIRTSFKDGVRKEFISEEHEGGARDQRPSWKQTKSVANYITRFRHATLLTPNISDGEKWDRVVSVLKSGLVLEERKVNYMNFEQVCGISFRIESALQGKAPAMSGGAWNHLRQLPWARLLLLWRTRLDVGWGGQETSTNLNIRNHSFGQDGEAGWCTWGWTRRRTRSDLCRSTDEWKGCALSKRILTGSIRPKVSQ